MDPALFKRAQSMTIQQLKEETRVDKTSAWARCCASVLQRKLAREPVARIAPESRQGAKPYRGPKPKYNSPSSSLGRRFERQNAKLPESTGSDWIPEDERVMVTVHPPLTDADDWRMPDWERQFWADRGITPVSYRSTLDFKP